MHKLIVQYIDKSVPVHVVKAYRQRNSVVPLIAGGIEGTSTLSPREIILVPTE
jgi:hypothetical protein